MQIRAKKLKEFLTLVSKVGNEASLKMNAGGLSTVVVDPAHVSIISAKLPASEDCEPGKDEHEFSVDVKKMLNYVSSFKPSEMVNLEPGDTDLKLSSGQMRFKMSVLTPEKWTPVPNLGSKLKAGGTFNTADLKAIVMSRLGSIIFESNGTLTAMAESDTDSIEVKGERAGDEYARATYADDYIATALIGSSVEMKFATDLPCILMPKVENLDVEIMVAPMIESD
jgi:hypothetical protein